MVYTLHVWVWEAPLHDTWWLMTREEVREQKRRALCECDLMYVVLAAINSTINIYFVCSVYIQFVHLHKDKGRNFSFSASQFFNKQSLREKTLQYVRVTQHKQLYTLNLHMGNTWESMLTALTIAAITVLSIWIAHDVLNTSQRSS